ncbi:hypothetical protein NHG31_06320 [Aerococcaceae bacterium NML171108]|nr:hypothetical protein [Aerococcaceae bacterium NML171108]
MEALYSRTPCSASYFLCLTFNSSQWLQLLTADGTKYLNTTLNRLAIESQFLN